MNLIINQMMQFQVMHVSDCNRAVEVLAGTSISQADFTVASDRNALPEFSVLQMGTQILHNFRIYNIFICCFELFPGGVDIVICHLQSVLNIFLVCTVENRGGYIKTKCFGSKA